MEKQGQWLLCPYCHGKTRVWVREDTVLHNFLLFCPKCKQEELIDLKQFHMTLLKKSGVYSIILEAHHAKGTVCIQQMDGTKIRGSR